MAAKMISNVSKIVHDKVSVNGPFKPFKYKCDNDLNALTVNKDFTQVVVVGRLVFRILNIKEDGFTDLINLRTNKSKTDPEYSISDVTWHPNDENVLASAGTNGCVVVWNINTRKKEVAFHEHKRSVNRVAFHGSEHNHLLSASTDGVVMIHDIRQPNFCLKFGTPGSESVKDAQFCPPHMGYFTFAAAYGNSVQTWDTRNPEKYERHFMAHNGPVYTLDWHPTDRNLLATAGRDKMIKVWDLSIGSDRTSPPPNLHTIANIAPVAHIKWRPQRKYHISSCSLQLDNSVNVWDVNRPYIPFARFEGHDNTATCIKWREDCHTFLTCGKDGNVIQHVFADAKRPADEVNLAAVDISINGRVSHINSEKHEPNYKIKRQSRSRQFTAVQSSLCLFQNANSQEDELAVNSLFMTEEEQFVHLAQRYHLEGSSFVDMCHHNGHIAESFQKSDVAHCWRMVATLFSPSLMANPGHMSRNGSFTQPSLAEQEFSDTKEHTIKSALKHPKEKMKNGLTQLSDQTDGASGSNDDSSEVEGENSEVDKSLPELNITTSVLFGEGGMDGNSMVWYNATGMLDHSHYNDEAINNIPSEGFHVRHELNAMTGLRPLVMDESDMSQAPLESQSYHHGTSDLVESSAEPSLIVKCDLIPQPHPIDFTETVADMIKRYAEMGDVQTVVTMLIVIGDKIQPYLDEAYQESWFFAYIDLLGQFELWKVANTVIKHSKLLGVSSMNQESTIIHTYCVFCSRPMDRSAWLCDKCKRVANLCSICHYPVKGRMAWCQGCGHGGHREHLKVWFDASSMCPAGCGHKCEFV